MSPEECADIEDLTCQHSGFKEIVELKERNGELKAMVSIGGWNAGSGEYSIGAANPGKAISLVLFAENAKNCEVVPDTWGLCCSM